MIASHRPPRRVVADATSCNMRTALRDVAALGVGARAPPPTSERCEGGLASARSLLHLIVH